MKNNKTYLAVRNITLDSEIQSGEVLYNSDPSSQSMGMIFMINFIRRILRTRRYLNYLIFFIGLSNADINTAINENLMAIYEEYKPTVNELLISVISPRVVRFNNEVSFEDLFVK